MKKFIVVMCIMVLSISGMTGCGKDAEPVESNSVVSLPDESVPDMKGTLEDLSDAAPALLDNEVTIHNLIYGNGPALGEETAEIEGYHYQVVSSDTPIHSITDLDDLISDTYVSANYINSLNAELTQNGIKLFLDQDDKLWYNTELGKRNTNMQLDPSMATVKDVVVDTETEGYILISLNDQDVKLWAMKCSDGWRLNGSIYRALYSFANSIARAEAEGNANSTGAPVEDEGSDQIVDPSIIDEELLDAGDGLNELPEGIVTNSTVTPTSKGGHSFHSSEYVIAAFDRIEGRNSGVLPAGDDPDNEQVKKTLQDMLIDFWNSLRSLDEPYQIQKSEIKSDIRVAL